MNASPVAHRSVLLTDGNARGVLAAARTLAAAGFGVGTVAEARTAAAHWSRASGRRYLAPDPRAEVETLAGILWCDGFSILISGSDAALRAISGFRTDLPALTRTGRPSPDPDGGRSPAVLDPAATPEPGRVELGAGWRRRPRGALQHLGQHLGQRHVDAARHDVGHRLHRGRRLAGISYVDGVRARRRQGKGERVVGARAYDGGSLTDPDAHGAVVVPDPTGARWKVIKLTTDEAERSDPPMDAHSLTGAPARLPESRHAVVDRLALSGAVRGAVAQVEK